MENLHLTKSDAAYPRPLLDLGAEAPEALWLRGVLPSFPSVAQRSPVAIVGARAASASSLVNARQVAAGLAAAGRWVISGGALGVDGAAHRGALDGGGATVVVFGTGLDVCYPSQHKRLFDDVVAAGGALVSQFPPGSPVVAWTFPVRNSVIAALSAATVVIEASAGSGSLYTAVAAAKMGRRVVALAGSPGCDLLITHGAEPARSIDEILALLDGEAATAGAPLTLKIPRTRNPKRPAGISAAPQSRLPMTSTFVTAAEAPPEDPRARLLYEALDATPRDVGELAVRAGVPAGEALALAIHLELGGLAARAAGGRYHRHG